MTLQSLPAFFAFKCESFSIKRFTRHRGIFVGWLFYSTYTWAIGCVHHFFGGGKTRRRLKCLDWALACSVDFCECFDSSRSLAFHSDSRKNTDDPRRNSRFPSCLKIESTALFDMKKHSRNLRKNVSFNFLQIFLFSSCSFYCFSKLSFLHCTVFLSQSCYNLSYNFNVLVSMKFLCVNFEVCRIFFPSDSGTFFFSLHCTNKNSIFDYVGTCTLQHRRFLLQFLVCLCF